MKTPKNNSIGLLKYLVGLLVMVSCVSAWGAKELKLQQWQFHKNEIKGAEAVTFDDSSWETISVPHDWSISGIPNPDNLSGAGNGFFPMGIGWYRTNFNSIEAWIGKKVSLVFDGVYRNADVWINGHKLGHHAYGYTQFRFDLSPYLQQQGINTIAVRVDNSAQPNSRWYSGSGLIRQVWLEVDQSIHLEPYSLFVQTLELNKTSAEIHIEGTVINSTDQSIQLPVKFKLRARHDESNFQQFETAPLKLNPQSSKHFSLTYTVQEPRLWAPKSPNLYELDTIISEPKGQASVATMEFGIRKVVVSAERGFELNGKALLLLGGNVHHDNGILGAAAFPEAERRKVSKLKAAGFNAVRASHNPPSREFLRECDRQGLLVINESFDMWKASKLKHDYSVDWDNNWAKDIRSMVLRDRNHPSVVMWSVGNEVFERGNTEGLRLGHRLAAEVRVYDPTRPVTIGLNGLGAKRKWHDLDGIFAAYDVAGYNYEIHRYQEDHQRVPNRIMFAAESYQKDTYENWQIMNSTPWVIGDFVWTAIDYLGEAGIGKVFNPDEEATPHWEGEQYPWHGAYTGDIDITGWRKPTSHYRQIVWDAGESLYAAVSTPTPGDGKWNLSQWANTPMLPAWEWAEHEGMPLKLNVFSRYDSIKVWLNDKLIAEKTGLLSNGFKAELEIPYTPGELRVAAYKNAHEVESIEFKTPGSPSAFKWINKTGSQFDDNLVFVELELVDDLGRWVARNDVEFNVNVTGPAEVIGVATSDMTTTKGYQVLSAKTFHGRALVVVRKSGKRKDVRLEVLGMNLATTSLKL